MPKFLGISDAMSRYFFRCRDCLTVSATDTDLATAYNLGNGGRCACGGALELMGEVRGLSLVHRHQGVPCDARCTNATGPKCDCQCGGENHGTRRTVEILTGVGPVPVLRPVDLDKAAHQACEYRDALEAARLAIRRQFGTADDDYRAGRWIDRATWSALRGAYDTLSHAKHLRTHKGRLAALAQVAANVGRYSC